MEPLKKLNERLKEYFGADLDGNAFYRISWSTSQTEIRKGNFPLGNSGILNPNKETRELKKYPSIRDRYLIEKKCYLPPIGELPLAELRGFSYEPIFVFEDAKGNPLPVIWRAIEIVVQSSIRGPENVFTSRTEDIEKEALDAKDIEYFENVLEEESPYLPTMLHNREAVKLDGAKIFTGESSAD